MKLKYTHITKQLLIIGGIIAILSFLSTFSEDDHAQVLDRMGTIEQSNTVAFPSIGADKSMKGSISDILTRLFNSSGKIKSIFITAFDNLSINTIPSWTGNRFIDSTLTQSGDTINVGGDLNIEGDLTFNIANFESDIWLKTGAGIYYNSGSIDVGIGTADPQAKLDVAGAVIVGNTADACGSSKIGTVRFNTGFIQYCSFVNYVWVESAWSAWSTTCGSGTRTKNVTCQDPAGNVSPGSCVPGEEPADSETAIQGSSTCGWGAYGAWSTTCGAATRTRSCSTGAAGSANCAGSDTEASIQGSSTCGWSAYSAWSTTCGAATRTRSCSTGAAGSTHCAGSTTDSSIQGSSTCGWGGFSAWSTTCGDATRTRSCTTGAAGSANCAGGVLESGIQGSSTCGWGSWGGYGGCSQSCGGGTKSRSRSCSTGSAGSANCSGSATSSTSCNTQSCVVGCNGATVSNGAGSCSIGSAGHGSSKSCNYTVSGTWGTPVKIVIAICSAGNIGSQKSGNCSGGTNDYSVSSGNTCAGGAEGWMVSEWRQTCNGATSGTISKTCNNGSWQ